jgi:hypothetical protein
MRVASEALRVCEEYGVASERLWTAAYLGAAQLQAGLVTEGLATLEGAVGALTAFECWVSVAEYQGFLADGYLAAGRASDARRAVEAGFATVERTGEVVWRPELLRHQARVLLADEADAIEPARRLLAQARTEAEAMGASLFATRADEALAALGG